MASAVPSAQARLTRFATETYRWPTLRVSRVASRRWDAGNPAIGMPVGAFTLSQRPARAASDQPKFYGRNRYPVFQTVVMCRGDAGFGSSFRLSSAMCVSMVRLTTDA